MAKVRIRDTGKLNADDTSATYTAINGGNWLDLLGVSMRFEFTSTKTNNVATLSDGDLLTFKSNQKSAVQSPRITIQGLVKSTESETIKTLVQMERSKTVQQISGGAGVIDALPEASSTSPVYIHAFITNLTYSEVVRNGTDYVDMTIQLEQVR